MNRKNIFAFTEPGNEFPGYISINREENGDVSVTVRMRGNGGRDTATFSLPPEKFAEMAGAIYEEDVMPAEAFDISPELMNFGLALSVLKAGDRVCRMGWNGKGMYLFMIGVPGGNDFWTYTNGKNDNLPLLPFIAMKTADHHVVPWLASQTDMLAEDWVILE